MIFGHQDNQKNNQTENTHSDASFVLGDQQSSAPIINNGVQSAAPTMSNDPLTFNDSSMQQTALDQAQPNLTDSGLTLPTTDSTALADESAALASIPPKTETPSVIKTHEATKESDGIMSVPTVKKAPTPAPIIDDLLSLKQQVLSDLEPLVGHLDQTPEEKFRTTMMLIQSTDNDSLIKDAYMAAKDIPVEKIRAQALLDVVNEINYFTHKKDQQ